ncbi:MAG: hypothetical protein J6B37_00480 [Clostridia bacterium]|nr:hypothetical protein [Clostridia bacterium]
MKKIVSILVAVLVVFSMFAITASAAVSTPTISAVSNVNTAKVGDTVKVTVSTSKNSKLGAFTASLQYDTTEFEVVSGNSFGAFSTEFLNTGAAGKVVYVGAAATTVDGAKTTLFTVEFKVLKADGTIKFAVEEAYVVDDKGTPDDTGDDDEIDVTAQIASKTITIGCAHANTEDKVVESTCTVAGSKTSTCKDCGKDLGTTALPLAKHDFENAVVTKEATCTEKGEKTGKCKVCGVETKEEIPMVAHKYGDWKVITPATETKDGVKERTCEVCKTVDKGVISKKPTASAPDDGSANIPNTSASMAFAFAAAGLALATGTVVRRKRK